MEDKFIAALTQKLAPLTQSQESKSQKVSDVPPEQRLQFFREEVDEIIGDLDTKLNNVISMQEQEFLSGYNLFVTKKEKELRAIIERLNEKNSNKNLKDEKITQLEIILNRMRHEN